MVHFPSWFRLLGLASLGLCSTAFAAGGPADSPGLIRSLPPPPVALRRIHLAHAPRRLSFEPNRGQANPRAQFLCRGSDYRLFLSRGEAVLTLQPWPQDSKIEPRMPEKPVVLRMKPVGGRLHPAGRGLEPLPGHMSYFAGNDPNKWRTGIPTYGKVSYTGVYPGIDLLYYGNENQLEYDFNVSPGHDPRRIRLGFLGAGSLRTDRQGQLIVQVGRREVDWCRPVAYQQIDGKRHSVPARYVLRGRHQACFQIGRYDRRYPLTIDPVLTYSTFFGGDNDDHARAIAIDGAGNAYITGDTISGDFPTTPGAYQKKSGFNVSISKFSPNGTLIYSTMLGNGDENGAGIAVDAQGNAYVTGTTGAAAFPTTPGAFHSQRLGDYDAFVAKLDPTGSSLVYSTLFGSAGRDFAYGIALDSAGNAYIAGRTEASATGKTGYSALIAKINATGTGIGYVQGIGGKVGNDEAYAIAVDASGSAYVTGYTENPDFPTTEGAFSRVVGTGAISVTTGGNGPFPTPPTTVLADLGDAFVVKLDHQGQVAYSTYLGGDLKDVPSGIAVDSGGNATIVGSTSSHPGDSGDLNPFPTTPGAAQEKFGGGVDNDVFVTKLNPQGSKLVYSTFLGGGGEDDGYSVALDSLGNAYVTGFTASDDFPVVNAVQSKLAGSDTSPNAFIAKLNPSGSALVYSTYFGGKESDALGEDSGDIGKGIAVDNQGNATVVGESFSRDFPLKNAIQKAGTGGTDLFIARFAADTPIASVRGDLNGDGKLSIADVTLALQIAVGLQPTTPQALQAGDLNGNGKIETGDAVRLLRAVVGLEQL